MYSMVIGLTMIIIGFSMVITGVGLTTDQLNVQYSYKFNHRPIYCTVWLLV